MWGFLDFLGRERLHWVVATQIFLEFSPLYGEDEPILTNIFQMGWFNHQPVTSLSIIM